MSSKQVLILHTSLFILFLISSITVSIFLAYNPNLYLSPFYLVILFLFITLTLYSWKKFKGCPLTVWENHLRKAESQDIYKGSCLRHYSIKWFGVDVPGKVFDKIIILLFILPILVRVYTYFLSR